MDDIRGEHWRYVADYFDNNDNIHALRWGFYVKEKEDLINRDFQCLFCT